MINFKEAFGKNLKQIRKSKNITQETLAEMVGIHPRQISKIETGEHFPNSTTLENICISLAVSPKELFNFDLQEVVENTGSGDKYTYKAVIEGNIIYLDNENFRKQKVKKINSSSDIDVNMINLAKKIQRPVTVQYYEGQENYKSIEYNPDGTFNILKDNKSSETENVISEIKNQIDQRNIIEYFKLAVKALDNNEDLEKLEILLSGMKMGRK